MEKISVIVITKNEEKNIAECLESVKWADEIIIVDAESSDNTIRIAKAYTDKVYIKPWEGFVPQKRYAVSLASNEWVLSIDADERVSPELRDEIINTGLEKYDGYFIRRRNYFFGKEITTCGWDKDYQMRLFRKSKTNLTERLVHEGFEVSGSTRNMKNVLIHNTYSSLHNYLKKINTYSTLKAEEVHQTKKEVTAFTIFTHSFSAFFRYYISLKGFKDGIHGLIISFFNSVSTMLTYVKIWEKQKGITN